MSSSHSSLLIKFDPTLPSVPLIEPTRPRTTVYKVPERPQTVSPPYLDPNIYQDHYATASVPIVIDNGQFVSSTASTTPVH